MKLRDATEADLESLGQIEAASFPDAWSLATISSALGDARTLFRVAEIDGKICAFGTAWTVEDEGEITHLAVAPKFRGQGIGKLVLQDLLQECRRRGAVTLFLEVRPTNSSGRRLYEKFGFIEIATRKNYYNDGEDALVLKWSEA